MEKYTTNNAINALLNFLQEQSARQVVVLTDSNLDALYPHYLDDLEQHFSVEKIVVPAGEQNKSIKQATAIWQQLLEKQYDRDLVIVNFGGGMICDLGGFVAATYKRGVRCVNYPTTLLAMIDAAIGGKTAINLDHIKNCVGLIRQPDFIVPADLALLRTLPEGELLSGFGELVKYALIASRPLFDELLQIDKLSAEGLRPEWISTCIEYKNKIVAIDPDDVKERHVLNFGHTYGHAIESMCAAQGEPIPHGIAVAIGILFECQKAAQEGHFPMEDFLLVEKLIRRHFEVPAYDEALERQLSPYFLQDKKNRNGEVAFVQLSEIGKVRL